MFFNPFDYQIESLMRWITGKLMKEIETTTLLPAQSTGNKTTFYSHFFKRIFFLLTFRNEGIDR